MGSARDRLTNMWLNLGNGDSYAEDFWNVDHEGSPHPTDERVDLTGPLPWEPGTVTRAYLGHLLEHITIDQGTDLLRRLLKIAAPGCDLMIVGPDVRRAEAMHRSGVLSAEWLRLVRDGGDRWPGDRHLWQCEPQTVIRMLVNAEWGNIREIPIDLVPDVWPVVSRVGWQLAVQATA